MNRPKQLNNAIRAHVSYEACHFNKHISKRYLQKKYQKVSYAEAIETSFHNLDGFQCYSNEV